MTDEEKRIKVAELCGYSCNGIHYFPLIGTQPSYVTPDGSDTCPVDMLPDYLHDLNAIHEATRGLTPEQRATMVIRLDAILAPQQEWWSVFSTAAERCEAFALTMEG
jgi:hypothetical protein